MIIDLKLWRDKCEQFANQIDTSHYQARDGQNDNKIRQEQVLFGKLAECTVYQYFFNKDIAISVPDFEIYTVKQKSWDFDNKLLKLNVNLTVKGCLGSYNKEINQIKSNNLSWVFQNKDLNKASYYDDNVYACFVAIDLDNNLGEIKGILPTKLLKEYNLFEELLNNFPNKRAVYYDWKGANNLVEAFQNDLVKL